MERVPFRNEPLLVSIKLRKCYVGRCKTNYPSQRVEHLKLSPYTAFQTNIAMNMLSNRHVYPTKLNQSGLQRILEHALNISHQIRSWFVVVAISYLQFPLA
ncbi:hypothetical protein RRG08_048328 [Elysia crispata]|uniref:Uncharacterized protein n=1 Tax=Elysia crispata TaxID=231223 RepID=A0AAE0XUC6_9GAST|nr:hypothetical protein RRG08_048328 [Elysia crispata]